MSNLKPKPSHSPLVVYASREFDGFTYQLDPQSEDRLRERASSLAQPRKLPRIFISYDMKEDFEKLVGQSTPELVALLTGLKAEVVQQLGGVEFRDPSTDRALFTWPPARS